MTTCKRFAGLAMAVATMTTALGLMLTSAPASAHPYDPEGPNYLVEDARIDQVGAEFWSRSQFYMDTYVIRQIHGIRGSEEGSSTATIRATVWTTSWVGFSGCLRVEYIARDGRFLGSSSHRLATTGINGERRTLYFLAHLEPTVNRAVHHFNIVHWHCPKG